MQYVSQACNSFYSHCVPTFIVDQVKIIGSEIKAMLEKPYVGPTCYRYNGPGDDFLKARYFYSSDNPWELARSLFIHGIIASVGYLLASIGFFWMGYSVMGTGLFFGFSALHNYRQGNTLKKVNELIINFNKISPTPLDNLEVLPMNLSTFTISLEAVKEEWHVRRVVDGEGETVAIAYRSASTDSIPQITIKAYYFGKAYFKRGPMRVYENVKFHCSNALTGREIEGLIEIAKNLNL